MNNATTLDLAPSPWLGSKITAAIVKKAVLEKFGEKVANSWNPSLTRSYKN